MYLKFDKFEKYFPLPNGKIRTNNKSTKVRNMFILILENKSINITMFNTIYIASVLKVSFSKYFIYMKDIVVGINNSK